MSARRPRPRPSILSDPSSSGTAISKPPRRVSDEGKQHLSELAKRRHQEGGFQKVPGRPKRKPSRRRIAEMVAQAALEEQTAQQIVDVFKDGIADHQPIQIRLKAAEAWLRVDQEEAKQRLKEEKTEDERMDRETALAYLAERLTEGHAATLLRRQVERESIGESDVIDADVVDD